MSSQQVTRGNVMPKSGRLACRPATHLTDPLANGRFALAEDRDLTPEERRQHLLAVHDAIADEIGDIGTLDRMALRMALDLNARSLESKDLIAAARALAEFIRSMARLKLLDSLRHVSRRKPVPGRGAALWDKPARAPRRVDDDEQEQDDAGSEPAEAADEPA